MARQTAQLRRTTKVLIAFLLLTVAAFGWLQWQAASRNRELLELQARADSLLFLGRGADAEKMLKESEKRLPSDYNPPARLARVYLTVGRYADGIAATDRALELAYGPRKTTILATRERASLADAVFASAVTGHAAEINDFSPSSYTQPGPAVPRERPARKGMAPGRPPPAGRTLGNGGSGRAN